MVIEPFQPSDEAAVIALWLEVFPDAPPRNDPARMIRLKRALQSELFLVARSRGTIVGTTMGGYDGHRGWVYLVAVDPRHRRRGIGAALLGEIEKRLLECGCPKINLQIDDTNAEVVGFYEHLGYHVEPRISMGKILDGDPVQAPPRGFG
jgi:ribosomal protein S18 acetylase RimI-like enzyme